MLIYMLSSSRLHVMARALDSHFPHFRHSTGITRSRDFCCLAEYVDSSLSTSSTLKTEENRSQRRLRLDRTGLWETAFYSFRLSVAAIVLHHSGAFMQAATIPNPIPGASPLQDYRNPPDTTMCVSSKSCL